MTNGVCLTITNMDQDSFYADVMKETYEKTNLKLLKRKSLVNLERALSVNGRLNGHIVSGHIDGLGTLVKKHNEGIATLLEFSTNKEIIKYIVKKGSITVDGVSLTVVDVFNSSFIVSLIPQTKKETILSDIKINDKVNLECDIVGKYIEKLVFKKESSNLTMEFLKENGFS